MDTPKGCADPDACACRERIAELERQLERAQSDALMNAANGVAAAEKARADERERYVPALKAARFALDMYTHRANKAIEAIDRALGDE